MRDDRDPVLIGEIRAFIEQRAQQDMTTEEGSVQSRALEVITDPPRADAGVREWMTRLCYVMGRQLTREAFHEAFGRDPEDLDG